MILPDRRILPQKAVEKRNLSAITRAALDHEDSMWEIKLDGVHTIFICTPEGVSAITRQGKPMPAAGHAVEILRKAGKQGVFFAEAYIPGKPHSYINGLSRKKTPQPELQFFVWDYVTLNGWESGTYCVPRSKRVACFRRILRDVYDYDNVFDLLFYQTGKAEAERMADSLRKQGWAIDGVIQWVSDAPWVAGAGKHGFCVKHKQILDLDLEVTGVVEGLGKLAGRVGKLTVRYKDKEINVSGGCLTHQAREFLFLYPENIVGKVVQVHALGETESGDLREARFIRIRDDKDVSEAD